MTNLTIHSEGENADQAKNKQEEKEGMFPSIVSNLEVSDEESPGVTDFKK